MEFLNPIAFVLLIFIPIIWKIKDKNLPFKKEIAKKILINKGTPKKKRLTIYLIAYVFFVIALSRPVNGVIYKKVKIQKNDIIILLDGSYSMKKKDIYPNRFEAAINKLKTLFEHFTNENVALVIVKDYPYLISPLTTDYHSIIYLLKHIDKHQLFNTSANFSLALKKVKKLSKNPIILSISYKPRMGDILYVINSKQFENAINFTYSNEDIKQIINILKKYDNSNTITLIQTNELFYYPLLIGIAFLFLGNFSIRRKN